MVRLARIWPEPEIKKIPELNEYLHSAFELQFIIRTKQKYPPKNLKPKQPKSRPLKLTSVWAKQRLLNMIINIFDTVMLLFK